MSDLGVTNRVRNLRHQADAARKRAAQSTMAEDKASWLHLAAQWNHLADAESAYPPPLRVQPSNATHDMRLSPN